MPKQERWGVKLETIEDKELTKKSAEYNNAKAQMKRRTYHHELYGLLAKNKSIHEWNTVRGNTKYFSEGSTQYILRKTLADTIQRVPDGELETQYDKMSKEHIFTQYLFENKVMWSEFEGIDMMSNLTNAFKMSFIYAFAPVRTGFEKDYDDDARVSFNLEHWADVFVNPDCRDIRRPDVVWHRQYMSKAEIETLLTDDGNGVKDSTYQLETIQYILDHDMFSGKQPESEKLADQLHQATSIESLMLITEYRRGASEFVTFCPAINAVFRKVPNYDPRKGIPWNFLVLEPDPDFPLGISQVEFLLSDQQFNDLFQTSAYKNLLLAMEPPIMVSGWETNPSSYQFKPRRIWNLGNNPNNVRVEPVKIDNSILSGWATTREAIAASMLRNLNVMEGTIAKDAGTSFSKTAPGVEAQQEAKTININQYQKRVEMFVSQWAEQALRMYINAMSGVHVLTVDEKTRRLLYDIDEIDCIDGDKISIDFNELSTDMLQFRVRAGSLVQRKEEQELERLSQMTQPFVQNLNGWSEDNRRVIENDVLLPAAIRMVELSDTDLSHTISTSLASQMAKNMMAGMQDQLDAQGQELAMQGQQIQQMQMQQQAAPQQAQAMPTPEQLTLDSPPIEASMAPKEGPEVTDEGELSSPSAPPNPENEEEFPDQQVDYLQDLLSI